MYKSTSQPIKSVQQLNVLLSDEGHALLTDFGLSQAVQSSFSMTAPSRLGGSVNWMPPEYIDELEEYAITAEGDVWSFGMTALVRSSANHLVTRMVDAIIHRSSSPRIHLFIMSRLNSM